MSMNKIETLMIDCADNDVEFEVPESIAQLHPLEKMDMLAYWIKQFYFEYRKVIGQHFVDSFNSRDKANLPLSLRLELFQIIAKNDFPSPRPNDIKKICMDALNQSKAKK